MFCLVKPATKTAIKCWGYNSAIKKTHSKAI